MGHSKSPIYRISEARILAKLKETSNMNLNIGTTVFVNNREKPCLSRGELGPKGKKYKFTGFFTTSRV